MSSVLRVILVRAMFFMFCAEVLIACSGDDENADNDDTAPIISISGETTVDIYQGDAYLDAGATAIDDIDGSVEVTVVGAVDSNVIGTYTITYTAVDASGNRSTDRRIVNVGAVDPTPPTDPTDPTDPADPADPSDPGDPGDPGDPTPPTDTISPTITLNGSARMSIAVGSMFIDPGATAVDNLDPNVTVLVTGRVDTTTVGQYTLSYSAEDAAGNQARATRFIDVEASADTTKPIISINGEAVISINEGDEYSDAGASAMDDVDGVVPVTVDGTVNNNIPNTYNITYSARDNAGNTAIATRRVTVLAKDSTDFEAVGNFLVGSVSVPLGDDVEGEFQLHVQRFNKNGDTWTGEPLVLADGSDAPKIYADTKARFQEFYQDMINRGMPVNQMQQMLRGITGAGENSGVHIETGGATCGYSGAPRTIKCGPNAGWFTIAHESMHGWQWGSTESPVNHEASILFQDVFTQWSNFVYHTRLSNPEMLRGSNWELDYLNYGLQNDAEWLANVFAGWLYSPTKVNGANWEAMQQSAPKFVEFFNCLWLDGLPLVRCNAISFGDNPIKHPQYRSPEGVADVDGFSQEDKTAIWKVCMGTADVNNYKARFNEIVKRVAPDLPGSPADNYSLGYGDCNHDGTTDWICTYAGRGPEGVGNGNYLWNRENRTGAYTFIAGGNEFDTYAEYKQDPYSTLPSMASGALAQPWYREWQGEYGSCNGASVFRYRKQEWIDLYLKDVP